jgi:hypothetical protein
VDQQQLSTFILSNGLGVAIIVFTATFAYFKVWPEWTKNERPWQRQQRERQVQADHALAEGIQALAVATAQLAVLSGRVGSDAVAGADLRSASSDSRDGDGAIPSFLVGRSDV